MILLEDIRSHNQGKVTRYKEYYPENQPAGSLEATILILRMVHRFPIFKQAHPELSESFREELKILMTESCISRFQKFKEITAPFNEANIESVVEGLTKLAEMVSEEIELDAKFFQPAFAQLIIF